MKNVVSSYSEHWLAIIGVTFICCVMFFPGGIWGSAAQGAIGVQGAAMTVLRLDHLNKSFGSLVVTDDVNLTVAAGERHVIIGPNGAGKTSLINQIGGQLAARAPAASSLEGPRHHRLAAGPDQPHGRGAHVPAQQPVPESQRDRESAARAGRSRRGNPLDFFTPVGRDKDSGRARRGPDGAGASRRRRRAPARAICPTASSASSKSAWRSPASPSLLLLDEPTSGMSPAETARMIELIASAAAHACRS